MQISPARKSQQLATVQRQKLSVLLALLAFTLVGCESVTELLPALPEEWRVPANKPQTPPLAPQSASTDEMETQVRQEINAVREKQGLKPLENQEKLAEVARQYSRKMAKENFFAHVSPDGTTPAKRVSSAGIFYWVVGENLFKITNASKPVPYAIKGWMESPGHRENLLRPEYTETGVGVWREGNTYYMTQLFMRSQFSPADLLR